MTLNYIKNVAIVGATGNSGSHMTQALLATGRFSVTAITRTTSTSEPPQGCKTAKVNYDDAASLVSALIGQDALIITLSIFAPPGTKEQLIHAACDAGVPWIMPNEWSPDVSSPGVRNDVHAFAEVHRLRQYIRDVAANSSGGKTSYIAVSTGFWYEWSLAFPDAYGFDFAKKEATFFEDGGAAAKICTSTWPQVGRAVAAILSLPIKASDAGPALEQYRNECVYISSFTVSQRDMLDSILRVTGDDETDWTIRTEAARQRVAEAQVALGKGDRAAYVRIMYTRVFYDDGNGDYEKSGKLANSDLQLPKEDIDKATAIGIERSKKPLW